MDKVYEEYFDLINAAEHKISEIETDIDKNNEKISAFNEEVELLKKKHGFEELNMKASSLNGEKKFELERLISAKLMIIFEYINKFVHYKCFKNEDEAFKVLNDKFGIYINDYDYGFDDFFYEIKEEFKYERNLRDFIENDNFPTIWDHESYELAHEIYFRNEVEGSFEIYIPQKIVDNLSEFEENFEKLVLEVENSYEEKIREKEQKAKDERRKMYEELKEEFESEA